MNSNIINSFISLKEYCEKEDFKGWDPYDGLNSRVFNALPILKNSSLCRLIIIQLFKRSPINLRKIALVSKDYNSKGIALALSAYCNIYYSVINKPELEKILGTKTELKNKIQYLSNLLIKLKSSGNYSGSCWGYGFGWQSKAFYLPSSTPTVVATSFAVEALLSAFDIVGDDSFFNDAISAKSFILNDLNRIQKGENFMFSYSPIDNRAVYNATLLGSKTLALIYDRTKDIDCLEAAKKSVQAVLKYQNTDGSFPHSDQIGNKWRDNFHTGFKLESLYIYSKIAGDDSIKEAIAKGYNHWITHFFDRENHIAKYYENDTTDSIIDLHCLSQSLSTLYKLNAFECEFSLIENMITWANENMKNSSGFYYFQKKGKSINKIPYMRWPNLWMMYGLSFYIRHLSRTK